MSLIEIVNSSTTKRHDLLNWVTLKIQIAVQFESTDDGSAQMKIAADIADQICLFIRYLSDLEDLSVIESHFIWMRLSQLHLICLKHLEKEQSEKIFDSAELMIKVLSEDDVSIDNENKENGEDRKKRKKPSKKKMYRYSAAKEVACIVLIQLFEVFGNQFSSLVPLLFGTIFKNLKKVLEKSKYMHATFMTSLIQLVNVMVRNGNQAEFFTNYFSKFSKISKNMFEGFYSDKLDFPVNFVSAVMELWSMHFREESFIKSHVTDLSAAIYMRYSEGELGSYGFTNDRTRPSTAKSLAEILFDYYYVKKIISLKEIWTLYARIFKNCASRDIQVGTFESIIHFYGLCSTTDCTFLDGSSYLVAFRTLALEVFDTDEIKNEGMHILYRILRYFDLMHDILLPRIGDSSRTQMLFNIMGSENEEKTSECAGNVLFVNSKPDSQWFNIAQLGLAKRLLLELSSSFGNEQHHISQIKRKLTELSTCDVFCIRIHANEALKVFLTNFPELISETIESSLDSLQQSFKQLEKYPFAVNHGHALIIASMIEKSDKDYVSYELVMRITIFATSFIKNHTTSTSSILYYKGLICWILLIGLVNYNDEQYLAMQSSQLFLFWKVLLTHTFGYREEDELYRNLEIRNHALTCLLTYLGNSKMDKEVAKQISYLLIKCSNFNHSINLKSTNIDKALLINEHRILQIYLRLHEFIKRDFNSSLLILIVKNFSDPNLYIEASQSMLDNIIGVTEKNTSLKEASREESFLENTVETVLHLNDGFAFGISSKIALSEIQELSIKIPQRCDRETSGALPSKKDSWYHPLEREITKPITPILSLDYLIMLYGRGHYTAKDEYSPKITTSLVDSSMEIFSLTFPYINGKIQYSVIESLNVSLFSKLTTPLRNVAVAANVCVAINSALNIIVEKELGIDVSVGQLLIDSLKKIEYYKDSYLTRIKADCVGLICMAVSCGEAGSERMEFVSTQIRILVKNVVDIEEPYKRVLYALSLVSIYRYNAQNSSFGAIYEVIFALIQDPHLVVHVWSLKAMHILLERHFSIDTSTAARLLGTVESVTSDPSYGIYCSSILQHNYNNQFNSHIVVGQITETLTEILGPNIIELDESSLCSYRNLVIAGLTSNDLTAQNISLSIFEMLATFKLKGIVADEVFMACAKSMIDDAIVTVFGSSYVNCRFTGSTEIFSNDSSLSSSVHCFGLFTELIRLQRESLITRDIDIASWRYLDLYPTSEAVIGFLFTWIEQSCELNERWFDKLYLFFNMGERKLFSSLYKEFSSILQRKGIRKTAEKEIRGEEEKAIADSDTNISSVHVDFSSDSIHWGAKKAVLAFIKLLCIKSQKKRSLFNLLSKRLPELIKISFQASVSKVVSMQLLGLEILSLLLKQWAKVSDPENPNNSILGIEEAQITSALMPAFDAESAPDVVVSAINVCAEFLSSNIAPLERANRVSHIMVNFLEVYNNKSSSIKIGDTHILTQKAKRKIELAVLDGWSKLVQNALVQQNEKLIEFTRRYWEILVPLWIISLREYVMVKYEKIEIEMGLHEDCKSSLYESRSTKIELYDGIWLNFAIALGSILENDSFLISSCLNEEEADSFMFVLLTQCFEDIAKHLDDHEIKMKVLPAMHNILKCHISFDNIFEDDANAEIVGILDRLIVMGDNEEKYELVNIINDLIGGYTKKYNTHETFLPGIDKLYELLRLLLIPISDLIPSIKYNFEDPEDMPMVKLDDTDLRLLRHTFTVLENNVSKFDEMFKEDLYACMLYIMGRIYEDKNRDIVVPLVLPFLKSITADLKTMKHCMNMMKVFYEAVKAPLFDKINGENELTTLLILLTNGFVDFSSQDLERIVNVCVVGIFTLKTNAIATEGLRNVVMNINKNPICGFLFKKVLKNVEGRINADTTIEICRSIMSVVMTFAKKVKAENPDKSKQAFALCLNLSLLCCDISSSDADQLVVDSAIELISIDSNVFKEVLQNFVPESRKTKIGHIMENSSQISTFNGKGYEEEHLTLKSFK